MKQVQDVLKDLIINHGRNIIKKDRALQGYIEDVLAGYPLYKNISLNLAKEGILKSMANMQSLDETELKNFVRQIMDKYATESSKTEETIMAWINALGLSISVQKQSNRLNNHTPFKTEQQKIQNSTQIVQHTTKNKGFFKKLISGDFGLLKTYWVYGILFTSIFLIISYYILIYANGVYREMIILIINSLWLTLVFTGMWNATKTYDDSKSMLFLARVTYRLGFIGLIVIWIIILVSI